VKVTVPKLATRSDQARLRTSLSALGLIALVASGGAASGIWWERSQRGAPPRPLAARAARAEDPPAPREESNRPNSAPAVDAVLLAKLTELETRLSALESRDRPEPPRHPLMRAEERRLSPAEVGAGNQKLEQRLDDALAAEAPDRGWSVATEQRLLASLSSSLGEGTTLAEPIRCRSTMCRMVATHATEAAREQFAELASRDPMGSVLVPRNLAGSGTGGPAQSVVYFIRVENDHSDHPVRLAMQQHAEDL
jgi:hypothetical protein